MVSTALLSCVLLGKDEGFQLLIIPKQGERVVYEVSMNVTGEDPIQVEGKIEYKVDKVEKNGAKTLTSTQKGMIIRFEGGQEIRDDSPRTTQRKFSIGGEMMKSSDADADAEIRMNRLYWPNLPPSFVPLGYSWKLTDLEGGIESRTVQYKFTKVENIGSIPVGVIQFTLKEVATNGQSATGEYRINLKDGWLESSHAQVENFGGTPGSKGVVRYQRVH